MKHLDFYYEEVVDRFFDPKWGPWNTQETKDSIKRLFKEAKDYAKLMMDDRDGLLKANRSLREEAFELRIELADTKQELKLCKNLQKSS